MFKYLIDGKEVTFNSEEERLAGIAEAEANNYFIELLEEPDFEVSEAPESAFSQVISGEVPEVEEDFTQDPVESADAVKLPKKNIKRMKSKRTLIILKKHLIGIFLKKPAIK